MKNENPSHQVPERKDAPGCNVSQTLNFSLGVITLLLAGVAAYLIYKHFFQG
ncbi:MAG TPA: hypothetical protein VGW57_16095 [Chthoniobacterales bacterium]|nr:hypothetical protein [Chthoniobacterales bacterium]